LSMGGWNYGCFPVCLFFCWFLEDIPPPIN
jgi:hypothetical protein